jgi:hypothetical protein
LNGVTATFNLSGFTNRITRTLKIMGSEGELRASEADNEIEIMRFSANSRERYESEIIRPEIPSSGHGGGDGGIVDDFLDLLEDMTDVMAFFKNQKVVFDSAAALYRAMDAEKEYLQMEKAAQQGLYEIYQILHASKPYKQISRLPDLIHTVQTAYQELLNLKKQEVFADMDAAMKEIRQTASATQQDVIEMATKTFSEKYDVANKAQSLTMLDAMKIQISNLRQKYLKALMVTEVGPVKDIVSTSRSGVCHAAKLESAEDVDKYVADVKAKLLQMLNGHDALHII